MESDEDFKELTPATMVVLDPEQWEYVRNRGNFWKWIAVISVLLAVAAISTLLIDRVLDSQQDSRLETLAEENHDALEILQAQESPETIAQREAALSQLLVVVDCNQRRAIQDLADELVTQGVIKPVNVVCEPGE